MEDRQDLTPKKTETNHQSHLSALQGSGIEGALPASVDEDAKD